MKKEETKELLKLIKYNYPSFDVKEGMVTMWSQIMSEYSYDDVKHALEVYMADDRFQKQPPTAYLLVKGLPKVRDRIDFTKDTFYCRHCGKAFNDMEEHDKHFDKCSSIQYLIRENKKWFNRIIDRKFLWQLSDEEFEERYNKMLKFIMEHTKDEHERQRIKYYFNKPSEEEAKEFLSKGVA